MSITSTKKTTTRESVCLSVRGMKAFTSRHFLMCHSCVRGILKKKQGEKSYRDHAMRERDVNHRRDFNKHTEKKNTTCSDGKKKMERMNTTSDVVLRSFRHIYSSLKIILAEILAEYTNIEYIKCRYMNKIREWKRDV